MLIAGTGFGHLGMSSMKWHSHLASSQHLFKAINSNSIVDRATTIYLEDFHDAVALASVNTYPLVDFKFLPLDIQFTSQYPSSTAGYLV